IEDRQRDRPLDALLGFVLAGVRVRVADRSAIAGQPAIVSYRFSANRMVNSPTSLRKAMTRQPRSSSRRDGGFATAIWGKEKVNWCVVPASKALACPAMTLAISPMQSLTRLSFIS